MNKVDIDILLGTYGETKDEKIKRLEKENLMLQAKVDALTKFIKETLRGALMEENDESTTFN
jgi:hypothetical protein